MSDYEVFALGDVVLQSGMTLPDARLAYKTYGSLEVRHMPNAECRPIPSVWGHLAGSPGANPPDTAFIDAALKELLAS